MSRSTHAYRLQYDFKNIPEMQALLFSTVAAADPVNFISKLGKTFVGIPLTLKINSTPTCKIAVKRKKE